MVTDAPIAVPTKLARHGLSEVVNHLLASSIPVPFDFLIDNQLLRGSLAKFIAANNISTEDILPIEYLPAVVLSDESKSSEMDAWIGALDSNMKNTLLCGCYDGQVRVCDATADFSVLCSQACHEAPIRSVVSWVGKSGCNMLATGSKDHSVKIWELRANIAGKKKTKGVIFDHISTLKGHMNSVECLDIFGDDPTILSGDWDGVVMGFNAALASSVGPTVETDDSSNRKKRKDLSGNVSAPMSNTLTSFFTLKAHSQAVSGIQACRDVGSNTAFARSMYTCSWDHSMKLWDIETQNCINTSMGPKVMTSLDYNQVANAVATSHPDGRVRMWDSRERESTSTFEAFGNTDHWISQVKWLPNSSVLFAAVDYAGNMCLWDVRAKVPLSSRATHDGKALCVDWILDSEAGQYQVVSGGSDCAVKASVVDSF